MAESENKFEDFIQKFYIKYGKLQIQGFHDIKSNRFTIRSVSPSQKKKYLFGPSNPRN